MYARKDKLLDKKVSWRCNENYRELTKLIEIYEFAALRVIRINIVSSSAEGVRNWNVETKYRIGQTKAGCGKWANWGTLDRETKLGWESWRNAKSLKVSVNWLEVKARRDNYLV